MTAKQRELGHVELHGLGKRYENPPPAARPAVADVTLDIPAGEFLTFLGPSGCGKTTTLRMIAGFEKPTTGRIVLDGADMVPLPPNKRPMAMVFQNYALFPHLSVYDNVAYGLKIDRRRRAGLAEAVEVAMTSMNLLGLEHRFPHQLSGGQQQRVALARAIVMQPAVLLFDEPLSNLDAKFREQMRTEIRLLQRRMGITSLYVTHDQDEAMSLSDRIVVMNAGRIEQVATPVEVYTRPASVFVANFIGRASFLPTYATDLAEGAATVPLLGTPTRVAAHPQLRAGQDAVLMVRPQSVQVEPTVEGGNGVIVSSVYRGDTVDYEVETAHGTLLASVPDPDADTILAEQTTVRVRIDARRAYLLPADDTPGRAGDDAPTGPPADAGALHPV